MRMGHWHRRRSRTLQHCRSLYQQLVIPQLSEPSNAELGCEGVSALLSVLQAAPKRIPLGRHNILLLHQTEVCKGLYMLQDPDLGIAPRYAHLRMTVQASGYMQGH